MAVSTDFYYDVFGGMDYPDLDRLLTRAESEINCFILRAPETEEEMRQFDLAVCAQAEYMGLCGGIDAWAMSVSGTAQSFTLGSFSMSSSGSSSGGGSAAARGICSRAESYLERAGLLYRGCGVCC